MLETVAFILFGNAYSFFPSPSETAPALQISREAGTQMLSCSLIKSRVSSTDSRY